MPGEKLRRREEEEKEYTQEDLRKAKAEVFKKVIEEKFKKPGRPSSQDKEMKAILERVKKKLERSSQERQEE